MAEISDERLQRIANGEHGVCSSAELESLCAELLQRRENERALAEQGRLMHRLRAASMLRGTRKDSQ